MTRRLIWLPLVFAALLAAACGASVEAPVPAPGPAAFHCTTVEVDAISPFLLDAFQRDLAIDTPKRVSEELDETPELICTDLVSSRHGELPVIAYAAAHRPDAEMIFPLLIERGAEARDALPVSAHLGKSRIVDWLLARGVDPDHGDALVLAAEARRARMVMTLLDAGADPSRMAAPGPWLGHLEQTALHHAARHAVPELLTALLEAGADVDALDALERPPLSEAIEADKMHSIRRLLEFGASPHRLPFEDRDRLLVIAKRWGMQELVDELE